jgi:hypothetical protein
MDACESRFRKLGRVGVGKRELRATPMTLFVLAQSLCKLIALLSW